MLSMSYLTCLSLFSSEDNSTYLTHGTVKKFSAGTWKHTVLVLSLLIKGMAKYWGREREREREREFVYASKWGVEK